MSWYLRDELPALIIKIFILYFLSLKYSSLSDGAIRIPFALLALFTEPMLFAFRLR